MTNDSVKISFKVESLERKLVAAVIADTIGEQPKYAGAPSFNYQAGGWTIDKNSFVMTPEMGIKEEHVTLRMVFDALNIAGAKAEGNLTITLPMAGHTGNTLRNLANLIWSKQNLIRKALDRQTNIVPESLVNAINTVPIDTLEDFAKVVNSAIEAGQIEGDSDLEFDLVDKTLSFSFFNASLDAEEIHAYGILCWQLNEQAKKQKFSSTKQKETDNEKFAMRVWLIRLGFVGGDFKTERKVLLSRLSGNAAYATEAARLAAEDKRKAKQRDTEAPTEGSVGE